MKLCIDAINKASVSGAKDFCFDFRPLWLIATDEENTDTLNCRYHNHAFFELHVVTNGKLVYGLDEGKIVLEKGQFTIIPPRSRHKVLSHSRDIGKFTLAFEIDEKSPIAQSFSQSSNKALELSESATANFFSVLSLCESKSPYRSGQLYLSLCLLLFDISELCHMPHNVQIHKTECDDRVIKAKKYIEDNFDVFFTCEEVALYCRIGEKQLGRLFKKYENISLLEFIHKKKFESIKKLMCESNMSHRQIAETLGFSSAQYYGKFISRMSGMTPAQYKNHIEEISEK